MRVDREVGKGEVKITLSFPSWKEGNVARAVFRRPVPEVPQQKK